MEEIPSTCQTVNFSNAFEPGELCPCIFCSEKTTPVNKIFKDSSSSNIFCNLLNIKSSFASGFLLAPICSKCSETIKSMIHICNCIKSLEIQLKLQKETILSYLQNEEVEIDNKSSPCNNDAVSVPDVFSASKFRKSIQTELEICTTHPRNTQTLDTEITLATDQKPEPNLNISDHVQNVDSPPFYDLDDSDVHAIEEVKSKEEDIENTAIIDDEAATATNICKNCVVKLDRISVLDDAAKKISYKYSRSPEMAVFLASKFEKFTANANFKGTFVSSRKFERSEQFGEVDQADENRMNFRQSTSPPKKHAIKLEKNTIAGSILCEHCGENFHFENNYLYHKHKFHGFSPPNSCWKNKCRLIFKSDTQLREHEAECHPSLQCDLCGSILSGREGLAHHMKRIHPNRIRNSLPGRSSYAPSKQITVNRAQTDSEIANTPRSYTCETCNWHATSKKSFTRHNDSLLHKLAANPELLRFKGKFRCPEDNCEYIAMKFIMFEQHLNLVHGIQQEVEELSFPTKEDFQTWRGKLQSTENVKYNKIDYGKYYCSRSGSYKSQSKGVRKPKSSGSFRTGKTCPSRLLVKVLPDDVLKVQYYKTHLGHDKDPGRFGLTRQEKFELAKSLAEGLTKDEAVKRLQSSCTDTNNPRIRLISKNDWKNIRYVRGNSGRGQSLGQ